jgi:hypothetical protein
MSSSGGYGTRHLLLAAVSGMVAVPAAAWIWTVYLERSRKQSEQPNPVRNDDLDASAKSQETSSESDDPESASWTSLGFEEPLVIAMVG